MTSLADRLADPDAVLSRGDLAELGYGRQAIDACFRACPIQVPAPGARKVYVTVADFLAWRERVTYVDGERVRP